MRKLLVALVLLSLVLMPNQVKAQSTSTLLFLGSDNPSSVGVGEPTYEVFLDQIVAVNYDGGPLCLSSQPSSCQAPATDDAVRIYVNGALAFYHESMTQDYGPVELSSYFQLGNNQVRIQLIDLIGPRRGGSDLWLVPFSGGYTGTIDLSIEEIKPVQVVYDANANNDANIDLVLMKPTVVRVKPKVDITGNPPLEQSITTVLYFQGGNYEQSIALGDIVSAPDSYIDLFLEPGDYGTSSFSATIDASNNIQETNENNNQANITVDVKITSNQRYVYRPVDFPSDLSNFQQAVDRSGTFVNATFPLAPSKLYHEPMDDPISLPSIAKLKDTTGLRFAYFTIYLDGKLSSPFSSRVIAMVPDGFFDNYGFTSAVGLTFGDNSQVVMVNEHYWIATAHELGHTYGLWATGNEEEYTNHSVGRASEGYWVSERLPVNNAFCFMGYATAKDSFGDKWIDQEDYNALFRRLRTNQEDPEILLLTGSISPDGEVELYKLYRALNGIPSEATGNYTLRVLDVYENPVGIQEFTGSDYVFDADVSLDADVFAFSSEYPQNAMYIQIMDGNQALAKVNISAKLLHDAIDSLPDSAFVNNPIQRRNALYNKVTAYENAISAGAFTGGKNMLVRDIRPALERWLVDSYQTDSLLQYTKQGILELVDELIDRNPVK